MLLPQMELCCASMQCQHRLHWAELYDKLPCAAVSTCDLALYLCKPRLCLCSLLHKGLHHSWVHGCNRLKIAHCTV